MNVKRLFITEKPTVAKALAGGLCLTYGATITNPGALQKDGCYMLSNGDAVGPLHGHMLGLVPPEAYITEEQSKGDPFAYLPLFPEKFIKEPVPERDRNGELKRDAKGKPIPSFQLTRIVSLARKAVEIVNAGDIDREGQLIVDELLEYAGISPLGHDKPIWRLALVDPDEQEIKKLLLAGFENNSDPRWQRKTQAAYARQTGDWALGMTASRAYKQVTGFSKMSVGRVQTPTLWIVVERETAIQNFKPVDYFVPVITLDDGTRLRWFRRQGCEGQPGFDREGRIVSEAVARQIVAAILGQNNGEVSLAEAQQKYQPPPLPFSLGKLQSTASRRYGMTLQEVTKAAQSLYEQRKMISYVGTDCQFLPTSMLKDAEHTVKGLSTMFRQVAQGTDMDLRSPAWNDAKTDEHFAIVPTGRIDSGLTKNEANVFDAISRRFMAQFYPNHEYTSMRLEARFGADEFRAAEKVVTRNGWKDAEGEVSEEEIELELNTEAQDETQRQRGAVE